MTAPDPAAVAAKLSRGQRSVTHGLDGEFCILGCGESTARRLTYSTTRRPALTIMRQTERGPEFALSSFGLAVKAVLS